VITGQVLAAPARGGDHQPILSVSDLRVELSGRVILDRVGFELLPGEFTGLIGQNGAGKTTLLRVILGLTRPSGGGVLVDGRRLGRRNRSVGYVPQKFLLDSDAPLRARDLVDLGLDRPRLGIAWPTRARRRLVDEALEAVDAHGFADTRIGHLSGGEQQRVLIAHALISAPRLLLLDEPLANLDLRSAQEIVHLLARIAAERGVAVLISAHEINPLLPVMHRVVYLAGGRALSGTTDQVVRTETLSALYGHHVDVLRVHGRIVVVAADHTDQPSHSHGQDIGVVP
jgi:zinc/manganese transport system ATP-binding protein